MFLYKTVGMQMVWPYYNRGRLIGEDVWEPEPSQAELFKLEPADVLTTEEAAKLLNPLIKPLPSFEEMVLNGRPRRSKRRIRSTVSVRVSTEWMTERISGRPRPQASVL